ncbi:para-aminobenzoate synthetase component 1 [Desulfobaculum xiamenense]|uniref:Para-aminobenzoate synthetase component 1 n=1 Tax=Desulfobaculum xiamenense TaxID=995050 RepID=A0A846QPL4_9BACT|nr:anthranilate synthase component I family protein [Desulfobaculum xiamenense]NJB67154.1 para-aminobenzoate synthetase component 1 [Desulfobaculum xiamenense]
MHSHIADFADSQSLVALVEGLAVRPDADLFLSAPERAGAGPCRIGLAPCAEILVEPGTPREAIAEFLFATPGTSLGCLTYDYGLSLRGVVSDKMPWCPPGRFRRYRALVVFDPATGELRAEGDTDYARAAVAEALRPTLAAAPSAPSGTGGTGTQRASLGREGYMRGVEEVLERIRGGYTYQLCLSSEFAVHAPDLDPAGLFVRLWRECPAPFYALFRLGPVTVISTSPERFLRVADGEVLSQPIKGTLAFDEYRPELAERVTSSPKESAELSMIVDLIRNDISANCEYGSVRVDGHKSTFVVDNLIQMYTNVRGRLRADRTCLDLLLDAFPGGSVTGCPKLASMGIIEELEPHTRGVYCGSMVVVEDARNMESSIAIRTAVHDSRDGVFRHHAGSGIVVDSDPESEYLETLAKAGKFARLAGL